MATCLYLWDSSHVSALPEGSSADQSNEKQPIVIKQGGNGLGLVVAAVVIAGAAIYAINVWSTTKKETAPGRNLEQGIERIKEAAGKAIEQKQ